MQLSHTRRATSAVFDDPNLVSSAGLVPVMRIAADAGLSELSRKHLSVPGDKGANAGLKVASLVGGMVTGADSIDDMAVLRHGGMGRIFDRAYAPSTLGSFLRAFTFGHVRQLDAVASRFLTELADQAPLLVRPPTSGQVMVDIDDTIIEVHGHEKQGSGYGYSGVRGLNALLATASTAQSAPVVVAQRLRKGSCGSPRGAARLVADALKVTDTLTSDPVLVRADSAFYGHATFNAALRAGADVSVTVRLDPKVKAAIAGIDDGAWTPIEYTDAIYDEQASAWVSRAEVAEIDFTAFSSRKKVEQVDGRLIVRRIPDLNPGSKKRTGDVVRHVAFPRLLHHHRPGDAGHGGRGRGPPRTRDHRAGPRRPQALSPGTPALRDLHRERRLAGPGRNRVQSDPSRCHHHRASVGEGDHGHNPPQTHHDPSEDRIISPATHLAPAPRLAMGNSLDSPARQGPQPTSRDPILTTQPATATPATLTWTTLTQRSAPQPRAHVVNKRLTSPARSSPDHRTLLCLSSR